MVEAGILMERHSYRPSAQPLKDYDIFYVKEISVDLYNLIYNIDFLATRFSEITFSPMHRPGGHFDLYERMNTMDISKLNLTL